MFVALVALGKPSLDLRSSGSTPSRIVGLTAFPEVASLNQPEFDDACYPLIAYTPGSIDWSKKLSAVLGQVNETVSGPSGTETISCGAEEAEKSGGISIDTVLIASSFLLIAIVLFAPLEITPFRRTLVFAFCGLLYGLVFGRQVAAKFSLKLPGFCFMTTGATAVAFGCLFALNSSLDTGIRLGVYRAVDSFSGQTLSIDPESAQAYLSSIGLRAEVFVKDESLIIIFPESSDVCKVRFSCFSGERWFQGTARLDSSGVQDLRVE